MSGLKLMDVIKTVRWNDSPLSTNDESRDVIGQRTINSNIANVHLVDQAGNSAPGQTKRATQLDRLKKAYLSELPAFLEGKSIAQSFASFHRYDDIRREKIPSHPHREQNAWIGAKPDSCYSRTKRVVDETAAPHETPFHRYGGCPSLSASERVVRSHLRYLNDFEPFRKGVFSQSVLYEFLFYMVVERGRRESYTKRVIRSIMAYLKAGGALAIGDLSEECKKYIDDFRGMGGVKFSTFYRRMDAVTNALGDDQTKHLLSTARRKRALVFNDEEESRILHYCISVLQASIKKYVTGDRNDNGSEKRIWSTSGDHVPFSNVEKDKSMDSKIDINTDIAVADTRPTRINYERTIFEFSFAYVLGFLSGARIKSTVLKFSVDDVKTLLTGGRLEVLTKGVFVNVFLPVSVLTKDANLYGRIMALRTHSMLYKHYNVGITSETFKTRPGLLSDTINAKSGNDYSSSSENEVQSDGHESFMNTKEQVIRHKLDRGPSRVANQLSYGGNNRFFSCSPRQLELMLDRVYQKLFSNKTRAKGVRWHSQRRKYLGTINSKYGATTASESVGHRDLTTTMTYINNSLHMDDVRSRAGDAITERYNTIFTQ